MRYLVLSSLSILLFKGYKILKLLEYYWYLARYHFQLSLFYYISEIALFTFFYQLVSWFKSLSKFTNDNLTLRVKNLDILSFKEVVLYLNPGIDSFKKLINSAYLYSSLIYYILIWPIDLVTSSISFVALKLTSITSASSDST